MENLQQIDARVESYVLKRLQRMSRLAAEWSSDPRDPQGIRHSYVDVVTALLAGLISGRRSLRDVEKLSTRLGLRRRGGGISDGALTHVLGLCDAGHFDAMVVRTIKDMNRRGELPHPGLGQHWTSIDGKYSCTDHHCGGLGQKFVSDDGVYWRAGVLRAVMISVPSRPALGQRAMGPVETTETDPEKVKHTGEITNLPHLVAKLRDDYGDLVSNFVLDAGLWSKDVFLSMDAQGFGLVCGLKKNKPDLFAEVERVLRIERQRRPTQEFTEKLAAIIPPPRANQVLYAGVLAGNAALRADVVPRVATSTEAQREARAALKLVKAEDRRETTARAEERRCWAELLKRVFEVNGWACPHCNKPMALRSIVIREPATTKVVSGLLRSTGPPAAA